MFKFYFLTFLVASLVGCANPNVRSNPRANPLDGMRESSINIVKILAKSTASFIKAKSEGEAIELAKESLTRSLKDPGSAQFRNVRLVDFDEGKVICGEINAKNSYGGYVGFKRFVAGPFQGDIEKNDRPHASVNEAVNAGLTVACGY